MDSFFVKWVGHSQHLSKTLWDLYKSNTLTDCVLDCNGIEYQAHSVVLMSGCSVLAEYLQERKESSSRYEVHNMSAKDLESLLELMYRGETVLEKCQMETFPYAAAQLGVQCGSPFITQCDEKCGDMQHEEVPEEFLSTDSVSRTVKNISPKKEKKLKIEEADISDWMEKPEMYLNATPTYVEIVEPTDPSMNSWEPEITLVDVDLNKITEGDIQNTFNFNEENEVALPEEDNKKKNPKGAKKKNKSDIESKLFKKGNSLICDLCGHISDTILKARRHRVRHIRKANNLKYPSEMPQICEICSRVCSSRRVYNDHMLNHTYTCEAEYPFECHLCKKRFLTETRLKIHLRYHNVVKKCQYCDRTFKAIQGLETHMALAHKISVTNQVFPCPHCDQEFLHKRLRELHMIRKHEIRYTCSECGAGFTEETKYLGHKIGHRGLVTLQCPVCQKSFPTNEHVTRHVAKIHKLNAEERYQRGSRMHSCLYCSTFSTYKLRSLYAHVLNAHSENTVKEEDLA